MGIILSAEAIAYIIVLGALTLGSIIGITIEYIKSPSREAFIDNFFADKSNPCMEMITGKKPDKPIDQQIIDLIFDSDSDSDSDDYERKYKYLEEFK